MLCKEIIAFEPTCSQWAAYESCDMFQQGDFVGGFDSIEEAFCFSYFDKCGNEFWFQLNISQVLSIANKNAQIIKAIPANKII